MFSVLQENMPVFLRVCRCRVFRRGAL